MERWLAAIGILPFRCESCTRRYRQATFSAWEHRYARCPKCANVILRLWDAKTESASFLSQLKVAMGAHTLRCERCRLNFGSIRPRMPTDRAKEWTLAQRALHNHSRLPVRERSGDMT